MKWLTGLLIGLMATAAQAQDSLPWWRSRAVVEPVVEATASSGLFSETERDVLLDYLHNRHRVGQDNDGEQSEHYDKKNKKKKSLPPGLQKKLARGGELPPGWQKKVARGEVLDAELYRHSHGLPHDILERLPHGPDGTSVRQVEDRVVRILDATGVILDVLGSN